MRSMGKIFHYYCTINIIMIMWQVLFILVMCVFHFIWVGCLAVCQTYQVIWLAMTTNERMNAARYKHFQRGGKRLVFRM